MRGLYAAKPWFTRQLGRIVTTAVDRGWSPDAFTAVGVAFAVVAAGGLLVGSWPVVLVGLVGRLAGANLDGAVARARGVSRPFGFVLNEIGDRVSDVLPFAALGILAWQSGSVPALVLALVAMTAASWPTFISLSAAAAGAPRINGGPFGRTERTLTVFLMSVAFTWFPVPAVIGVGSGVIIAGSALTAATRARAAHRHLRLVDA
ncbi:CDP-alcohol phosphatidyltransferase family protein [Agromyces sp. NPDC057865]|uniref:CDP-alcohol phosphatidyltransferase family protein n=1 Tax=Agromyces sp. NPDC057865 TaxID=3346267 RepID=UPI00366C85F3